MARRTYIDWLRGVAVVIMIEWHAIDAWTAPDARGAAGYAIAALVGGWAAPLFLFLAGAAIPLAGAAHLRRLIAAGPSDVRQDQRRRRASRAVQKRGWQVFALAHLFRLQSVLFNPTASWSEVLKPDILNILGLGMVGSSFCWGRATTRWQQVLWLLVPAAVVVLLTPSSRVWWWPTVLYPRLEAYIRPVGNLGVFSLFPWVAFVFVGAFVGAVIAEDRTAPADRVFHRKLALAGLAVAGAGGIGMYMPSPLAGSDFWTSSLSFFLIRVGVMTVALSAAWLWMRRRTAERWSPLVVFGRTSLFVYWVHVALAYGVFSYPLHRALPLPSAIVAFGLLTLLMLGLAVMWRRMTSRSRK